MNQQADGDRPGGLSRRDMLRTTGLAVGSALAAGRAAPGFPVHAQESAGGALTPAEYAAVDAISARIIPADDSGPGAREAMAVRYIDRALAGPLASSLPQYREGLAALDQYARSLHEEAFALLPAEDQDALLGAFEDGEAPGFPGSAQFFNMVRTHTIQGTFSDPVYGGNANFAGWDMIGYPGVRVAVPRRYQQMNEDHTPNHASAYDSTMFNRPPDVGEAEP
jgi:gluconate 2-dehydrogenase gamma chain